MTIVYFLLMLGVLIAIHEAGHMLVAKAFNIYVREFSIGFGPVIWKKQGKETLYSLRAIPLGGFTGMIESEEENAAQKFLEGSDESSSGVEKDNEGDEAAQPIVEEARTFYGAKPWKRILVLLAGPLANLLLAIVVFMSIFMINGYDIQYPKAVIETILPGSAAEESGIQPGDEITFITYSNGERVKIESTYDVTINNEMHKGEMVITLNRQGSSIDVKLTPRLDEESGRYLIGVTFGGQASERKLTLPQAMVRGFTYTFEVIGMTVKSVAMLLSGQVGAEAISGTIGIYSYTQEAVQYGFISYLSLVGSISVSLGIMNLLPVPVFDGGRIVLTVIEMIIGHRLSRKFEETVLTIGVVLIVILFLLVTYLDITKLFK